MEISTKLYRERTRNELIQSNSTRQILILLENDHQTLITTAETTTYPKPTITSQQLLVNRRILLQSQTKISDISGKEKEKLQRITDLRRRRS